MNRMILAVLPLVILAWSFQAHAVEVGDIAPNFNLESLDGQKIELNHYQGKTVLLVFGATWCPNCRKEVPELKEAAKRYKDKGLRVVYIDVQESGRKVRAFAKKYGIQYAVLLDPKGDVARKYHVHGIPLNLVIGPDRKIKFKDHFIPRNLADMITVAD